MAKFITEDKNPFKQIQQDPWGTFSYKNKMNVIFSPSEKSFQPKWTSFFSFKTILQNFHKAGQICEKCRYKMI